MPSTARKNTTPKSSHRLSGSMTEEPRVELTKIAEKNKLLVAWVVRKAVERLLRDEQLMFHVGQAR